MGFYPRVGERGWTGGEVALGVFNSFEGFCVFGGRILHGVGLGHSERQTWRDMATELQVRGFFGVGIDTTLGQ